MAKLQFLLREPATTSADAFGDRVRREIVPRLAAFGPGAIKVTFTEVEPPRLTVLPFRRARVALFSVWPEGAPGAASQGDASAWGDAIDPGGKGRLAGYHVDESVPVAYERTWADGQTTPGAGLLTLFRRKKGLDDATFLERWHGGHTPLSLRIHPLWAYVRNVVGAPVVEGSPVLDAIVEEHFRTTADLVDPTRFFGGARAMVPNMARVAADVARFIDTRSMEVYFVSELHVRSAEAHGR